MVVAICAVIVGTVYFNANNATHQSEADILLSENVEALSANDVNSRQVNCFCKTNIFTSNVCSANASGSYCGGDPCSNHDSNCR